MSKRKDGGPAFPRGDQSQCEPEGGMSLRDYFAGEALKGVASSDPEAVTGSSSRTSHDDSAERANVARSCYEMADAMLKARRK